MKIILEDISTQKFKRKWKFVTEILSKLYVKRIVKEYEG